MFLPDVNILVHAHREDSQHHTLCRSWLISVLESDRSYGMADLVLSAFLRIVTHPRILNPPSPRTAALAFVDEVRNRPHCVPVTPGPRHWDIFLRLLEQSKATGNLIPDAFLAALAIESGSIFATLDQDYRRFPGLRWEAPSL